METLSYKEFLITLKYAALKYLDKYPYTQEIDVFYDEKTKEIVSIIKMPYMFQIKQFKTTLAEFIIYVTTITNPDIDINLIKLRMYRIFFNKSKEEFASILGCSVEQYEKIELNNDFNYVVDKTLLSKLNVPNIDIDHMVKL